MMIVKVNINLRWLSLRGVLDDDRQSKGKLEVIATQGCPR